MLGAMKTYRVVASLVLGALCMLSQELFALESSVKLGDGTSISVPESWTTKQQSSHLSLFSPEGDLKVEFVSLPSTGHFENEVMAAWKLVDPSFSLKPFTISTPPAEEGWESFFQITYDIPESESRMVLALLRGFKGRSYISLVSGSKTSLGKRNSQVNQVISGWKPNGLKDEDLSKSKAAQWTRAQSEELERFVKSSMKKFDVPGVSIGIVQNGKLVYSEGFGVRDLQSKKPVTPNTLFMIGSTTKPLTTLLISKLIEDKKITWETPLTSVLKGFSLADPLITQKLQFKHTVCACTGMPRQDLNFIFKYSGVTPEQRLEQMKIMKPTTGFGEAFQYSNWLVSAGGYAAARVFDQKSDLETAYQNAMKDEVFAPLGMTHSVLKIEDAVAAESARPHGLDVDSSVKLLPLNLENAVYSVAPSGAVWSNVNDMAKYLSLELADGVLPSGNPYLNKDLFLKRRERGIQAGGHSFYGLGLFIEKEQGLEIFGHGGNTLGFSSDMYFIPNKQLGVVVLTNLSGASNFLSVVKQKMLEIELGAKPRAETLVKYMIERRNIAIEKTKERISYLPSKTVWIKKLLGTYQNADLGSATIRPLKKGYEIQFAEWKSALGTEIESNGEKLLSLVGAPWAGGVNLLVKDDGNTLVLDDNQHKYEFKKKVE